MMVLIRQAHAPGPRVLIEMLWDSNLYIASQAMQVCKKGQGVGGYETA